MNELAETKRKDGWKIMAICFTRNTFIYLILLFLTI